MECHQNQFYLIHRHSPFCELHSFVPWPVELIEWSLGCVLANHKTALVGIHELVCANVCQNLLLKSRMIPKLQ